MAEQGRSFARSCADPRNDLKQSGFQLEAPEIAKLRLSSLVSRLTFRQERRDDVVEKAPSELGCADLVAVALEPAACNRISQSIFDRGSGEPRRRLELPERETALQPQRVEHEFERQLLRRYRIIAADRAFAARLLEIAARRARLPAAADGEAGSRDWGFGIRRSAGHDTRVMLEREEFR